MGKLRCPGWGNGHSRAAAKRRHAREALERLAREAQERAARYEQSAGHTRTGRLVLPISNIKVLGIGRTV